MNFDSLKECSRCGSDACYSQEVSKGIIIELCYGCGFQSNSVMTSGSQFLLEQMELLPELYKELMGEDENGVIWMPSVINIPNVGMVFAEGTRADNWVWAAVKATPMSEEEKAKFKAKGKDYDHKMDMETMRHFPEREYMEALDYIGVFETE